VLASKNSEKMPRKSKNQENSVNQLESDEIKSQSNISKNQRQYGEGQEVGKGKKQYLVNETKIRGPPQWSRQFMLQVNPPADKRIPS
jgi:hypothetical protein